MTNNTEWYRDDVIRCPKCGNLQQDFENQIDPSYHGCTKSYKSKCIKCGFVGWVPERRSCGIDE